MAQKKVAFMVTSDLTYARSHCNSYAAPRLATFVLSLFYQFSNGVGGGGVEHGVDGRRSGWASISWPTPRLQCLSYAILCIPNPGVDSPGCIQQHLTSIFFQNETCLIQYIVRYSK
jgi:hypothetical protein